MVNFKIEPINQTKILTFYVLSVVEMEINSTNITGDNLLQFQSGKRHERYTLRIENPIEVSFIDSKPLELVDVSIN